MFLTQFPPEAQDLVHGLLYKTVRVVISDVQDFGIRDGSKTGRLGIVDWQSFNLTRDVRCRIIEPHRDRFMIRYFATTASPSSSPTAATEMCV